MFQIVGSVGDFSALAFAPQSLCAPVGGCTIVANVFMAQVWLGETMSRLDLVATSIVTVGVVSSAFFADKSPQCFDLADLREMYFGTFNASRFLLLFFLLLDWEREGEGERASHCIHFLHSLQFFVLFFRRLLQPNFSFTTVLLF